MSGFFKKIFAYIPRKTEVSLFGWQHWLYIVFTIAIVVFFVNFIFQEESEN